MLVSGDCVIKKEKAATLSKKDSKDQLPHDVASVVNSEARVAMLTKMIDRNFESDQDLDAITELASKAFDAPVTLVSLVDTDVQWFKSKVGIEDKQTEVSSSFCAHAISQEEPETLIVPDTLKDKRFANNRLVTGEPHIRFYAGHPLVVGNEKVGTLCVIDVEPREEVTQTQLSSLEKLAALTSSFFELKYEARSKEQIQNALSQHETRSSLSQLATKISSWVWHPETDVFECDDVTREKLGLNLDATLKLENFTDKMSAADADKFVEEIHYARDHGSELHFEFKTAHTNRWFAIKGKGSTLLRNKQASSFIGVLLEITDKKQSGENTKILLKELNHRVKNTLAVLQSLSTQASRSATTEEEYNSVFFGRVQALSAVHDLLSKNEWKSVDLHPLVHGQLDPIVDTTQRLSLNIPNVAVTPDQALGLGLVLHELAMRALHIGALSGEDGRVSLTAKISPSTKDKQGSHEDLVLHWSEVGAHGAEPLKSNASQMKLIEKGLDKVLGSRVAITDSDTGIDVAICLPLTQV